jgi:hypothetical protein
MNASPRPSDPDRRSSSRGIGRVIWTIVKVMIIPVLCVMALILGMVVGYAILGGRPVSEVFEWNTWKHMYDLVYSDG